MSTTSQPATAQAKPRKRIAAFDVAKIVALLAVFVGHTSGIPQTLLDFVFSFHMPVFFVISGYFFHREASCDKPFVKKNARALLVPYAWTCLLVIVVATAFAALSPDASAGGVARWWALASLYGAGNIIPGMPAGVGGIGALWFLLALFWARIFLALANRAPYTPAIIVALFIAGWMGANVEPVHWLPFSIQAGMCATLFLYLGQMLRARDAFAKGVIPWPLWLVICGIWLWGAAFYGHLYMNQNVYADGVLVDIVVGICGAMCVIKGAMLLEAALPKAAAALGKLGSMTLPLFCAHLIELDAFPWQTIMAFLAPVPAPSWIVMLAARLVVIAALTGVLYVLPRPISGAFFPSRATPAS